MDTGGNQVKAAQLLGISRRTLRTKLLELGLKIEAARRRSPTTTEIADQRLTELNGNMLAPFLREPAAQHLHEAPEIRFEL